MPKTLSRDASIATVRAMLEDPHVHMVLLTRGVELVGTVVRSDLPAECRTVAPAVSIAMLENRTVAPSAAVAEVRDRMMLAQLRRLAVVDEGGRLVGLLCLKRDGSGFCDDDGVRAREVERSPEASETSPGAAAATCPHVVATQLGDRQSARRRDRWMGVL